MAVHYTPNGFPIAVKWTPDFSNEIMDIFKQFAESANQGFAAKLPLIERAVRLEEIVGDLFTLAMDKDIKLTPNVRTYILKYATLISSENTKDHTPLDSWMIMFAPDATVKAFPAQWTVDELKLLKKVAGYPTHSFSSFVVGPGVGKYMEYLRLRLMAV